MGISRIESAARSSRRATHSHSRACKTAAAQSSWKPWLCPDQSSRRRGGGATDYLDETCGICISPGSRHEFIEGWTDAILRLSSDQDLRLRMGQAGRQKIEREFSWQAKILQIVQLYDSIQATKG